MKLPRDLSGARLAQILAGRWGYVLKHQTGSHMILETEEPRHQRIAIPAHKCLRVGTLHAILRSVAQHKGIGIERILED